MALFQDVLYNSRNIVVIAGAGLSAASGIPTFRGPEGLWKTYDVAELENLDNFEQNPVAFWRFYSYFKDILLNAQPNEAHLALAKFSLQSTRDSLMPENRGTSFTLITQNVDGLSTTALSTVTSQSGSLNAQFNPTSSPSSSSQPPIIELHGRLLEMRCTNPDCSRRSLEAEWPVVPLPRGNSTGAPTSSSSSDLPHREFGLNLPRCEVCGSMCRPGDVWFGEQPLHGKEVKRIIDRCDFCIVVGTSSTVYPAAGYPSAVKRNGGRIAVFNTERTAGDGSAEFLFLGPCEDTVPKAFGSRY